jgi:diguanylate cyclase (GGDEF)-like protein
MVIGDMRYTGRIAASCLDLIFIIFFVTSYYNTYGRIQPFELIGDAFSLGLTWWCGKQYDKAKFYSEKDLLTKVYNRRFVYEIFPKLMAKSIKFKEKISIFLLDIDDFKRINDTFGHEKGDIVIQRISDVLFTNTRKGDIVARWGGDEFLIIVIHTNELCATEFMKRIELSLQKMSYELDHHISASIGSAIYPTDAKDLDQLVKLADHRMYEIKGVRKHSI